MVYGSMLTYFPELFRKFEYFSMKPQVTASYGKKEPIKTIRGVFQYMKKGALIEQNDTLDDTDIPVLWTKEKLKQGNFITADGIDFRLVSENLWLFEGGFTCYVLETVTGNSYKQEKHDYVNLGQHQYD